ncbi:MAG: acetate--CoA ligase family protein [Nannocystaceae bacterium]
MEADAGLIRALDALVADDGERGAIVATAEAIGDGQFAAAHVETVPARELGRRVHEATPVIVVVDAIPPTTLRALREAPPALLVLTGEADDDLVASLSRIPGLTLLGPRARLRIGDGVRILCAGDPEELDALTRALGGGAPRLAIAPTPPWLPRWLAEPALAGRPALGFVPAASLGRSWSTWIRGLTPAAARRHGLVPVGVDAPKIDAPRHPSIELAVHAQALELWSGPVFPSASVIAAIAGGLDRGRSTTPSASALARWQQARRALPRIGASPGMERPPADLDLDDVGAAFLAQRVRVRSEEAERILEGELPRRPATDRARIERSLEVLRSAGEVLSEHESKVVLRGFDVEVTRQAVASSASGAASFAETIGYPVVLKAVSPDLRRKQEVGAVVLDLTTAAAVRRAYATIVSNVEERAPTAHLDGVLVAEQIEPGIEIHCGLVRMASGALAHYGRALADGVLADFVVAAAPLSPADALLLSHAILSRGASPALRRRGDPDPRILAELFLRLDRLREESEDRLLSVDLNPLRLIGGERGYVTLDARILQRAHLEGL